MILETLATVFRKPAYLGLAFVVAVVVFLLATWLPNLGLIGTIISSADISLSEKFWIPISLVGSIFTNFTPLAAVYTILISILFGMYIALLGYYIQKRRSMVSGGGKVATGFLGLVSGALGLGCAACGSVFLTGTLGALGLAGVVSVLPFSGAEFGIIGVVLLGLSICFIAKQVGKPLVCETN